MAAEDEHAPSIDRAASDGKYAGPDAEEYAALAGDLRAALEGDVRFDEYAQVLYATDGSVFQARPAGVAFPEHADDVAAAVRVASEHGVPVLPRGAGSSLAGQAVGPGCVVLDLSRHMDDIVDVNPDAKTATVQPGVVQDHLDAHLAEWGLKFAPDPASANRATIGGGIGNNSTGAHSVRYGITDAYVDQLRVVLADGSVIRTRDVVLDSDEWQALVSGDDREAAIYRTVRAVVEENGDEIAERYPDIKRTVSGYNLQKVIREEEGDRIINLSKLLVGAEGTLGVVVEATLSLVSKPEETALALYCYDDLVDAMRAVPEALELDPSAVELMDDEVFRLASESAEFAEYAEPIPDRAAAALMVEFDDELHGDLSAAVEAADATLFDGGPAFDALAASDPDDQTKLWKLRKAAIPLLMSLDGDPKPYPFVEDASVPPDDLAEYVEGFQAILDDHDTSAAYFAHAGVGTLHIRPILNLKEEEGVERMRAIAEDVTSLVAEYDGSFSGEHGDGLARTQFNPKLYGQDLWAAFKEVKSAFDPDWQMNPGKVVFRDEVSASDTSGASSRDPRDGDPTDMREHLRYGPAYSTVEPATAQDFSAEGGYAELVELCNGCGTCRQTDTDTMCPTYRATEEEIATTRGRANLLRAGISGELPEGELYSERFLSAVLDLCIGCKACKSDCPTGVDMAKLKAELKREYHEREGVGLRERLFANVDRLSALGSKTAPLSNWLASLPGASAVAERALGIASERSLPEFRRESLEDWFDARGGPRVAAEDAEDAVLLFPDTYTNYSYPEPGKAAVRVLEAADVRVELASVGPTGRAAYSQGLLDVAADRAHALVDDVAPRVADGRSLLFVEPSDAAMVRDETPDLVGDDRRDAAETVAAGALGICEYLDRARADERIAFDAPGESLAYHGHCHQKALGTDHHAVGVLRRAGYDVDPLDSGCCGMAGSFGYEAEHYDLSQDIGEILFEQVAASDGDVVAPGGSCRAQLGDRADADRPPHPVEKLADEL